MRDPMVQFRRQACGKQDRNVFWKHCNAGTTKANMKLRLTCYSHSITEVDGVPHHGPVRNGYESLWILIGICCKCWK